jgi:hypothetical protein
MPASRGCPVFASAYMGRRNRAQPLRALPPSGQMLLESERALAHGVKALKKHRFRAMYAEANMRHPSRTLGVVMVC